MINEEACLMPDIKACKRFIDCFDALFIRDQELWFGRFSPYIKAGPNPSLITIYSSGTIFSTPKEDTLCFFDIGSRRWVMILSKHCRISWQVNTEDDEIYIRMLASIAEDELKWSKGDCNCNDLAITNRIKNRYSAWFENYNKIRQIIKARKDLKNAINSCYGKASATFENPTVKYTKYPVYKRPQPKFVQFNGDYTTVVWKDGSHTVVKKAEGEEYDGEKAILFAIVKHLCGDNGCEMDRYFEKFFKDVHIHVKNEKGINKEEKE